MQSFLYTIFGIKLRITASINVPVIRTKLFLLHISNIYNVYLTYIKTINLYEHLFLIKIKRLLIIINHNTSLHLN